MFQIKNVLYPLGHQGLGTPMVFSFVFAGKSVSKLLLWRLINDERIHIYIKNSYKHFFYFTRTWHVIKNVKR